VDERDSLEEVRLRGKIEEALNVSQREGLICGLNYFGSYQGQVSGFCAYDKENVG
jgi:hypothetical protein